MRTFGYIVAFILGGFILSLFLRGCGFVNGWTRDAAATAHKEYDASAMLKKYEWFKDQSERIQKMDKDIVNTTKLREGIREQFEADYGKEHVKWDVLTKEKYQSKMDLSDQMYLATIAQRNSLVAEYNAQSSKFNWAPFKSKTDLPPVAFEEAQ